MGVPSFYRWLVGKYPKIVHSCRASTTSEPNPNPNGIDFDNLYLDMNCIIHPCFHPEDELFPPKTYEEVFLLIFEYIDRVFHIVRPRKLLYLAVDGVAPRAKMNQQRSRRFNSARSAKIADQEEDLLRAEFERENKVLMPKEKLEISDSNIITPGTIFMERVSRALEYYIRLRLNSDPAWMNIKVILSDANVPGEGEHKIMSFIRSQRSAKGYNPNLRHCLYGLDADLIMLALATHEIHFYILREDNIVKDEKVYLGNNLPETLKSRQWYKRLVGENLKTTLPTKGYQFLNIWTLREYLELEMTMEDPPFEMDIERIVDDFVFICFFMGNDFLPHIPSLEAHEDALDVLIEVYKRTLRKTGGYLIDTTKMKDQKHAYMKVSRVEKFILEVGSYEEKIFLRRNEVRERKSRMLLRERADDDSGNNCFDGWKDSSSAFEKSCSISSSGRTADDELDVIENTLELRRRVKEIIQEKQDTYKSRDSQKDKVKLGSPGWKERYYNEKFSAEKSEIESTRKVVVEKYMEGLCWVLQYYFVGVCSWTWYYPYHYGPFASDFKNLKCDKINFKIGQPLKPLDQLMAVLPPQSSAELPEAYAKLMNCKDSKISKFYREDIEIDMDGKRFLWQGVIKLPFIDEELLLASTRMLESELNVHEIGRNSSRNDKIFARNDTSLGLKIVSSNEALEVPVDFASCEISGVLCFRNGLDDFGFLSSPIQCMDDIKYDIVVSREFLNPDVSVPVLGLLENVEMTEKTVTANDMQQRELWHERSNPGQTLRRNQGYSYRPDFRRNAAVPGMPHETWRCADSGWSSSLDRANNVSYGTGTGNNVSYGTGRGSILLGRGGNNVSFGTGSRPRGGYQGRGFARGHESFQPRARTEVCSSTSGLNRGRGSDANASDARGTIRPAWAAPTAVWRPVGPRSDWAGRGRARD